MTVYVDDAVHRFAGMLMCHMAADTLDELHSMADKIGLNRQWFQGDHYDICKNKRALATRLGAKQVRPRDILRIARQAPRREKRKRWPVVAWVTTLPGERSFSPDPIGWKRHAVPSSISYMVDARAYCGLTPKFGWGVDLFIEDNCERCEAALEKIYAAP